MKALTRVRISTIRQAGGLVLLLLSAMLAGCASVQTARQIKISEYLERIRDDPERLHVFVHDMPKGGDLHTHLSGVIPAESYLQWAADDGMCISTATWAISAAPCNGSGRPVVDILADRHLYDQAIDGLSMRHFPLAAPLYGHDHFFKAFSLFGAVSDAHKGQMLAEATGRAARDNTGYLELMITLQSDPLAELAAQKAWTGNVETDYQALLDGVRGRLAEGTAELTALINEQRNMLSCDGAVPDPACHVTLRFIQQANRVSSPQKVFASLIFGAEMATRDPRLVAVDLVAPEDAAPALADYALQMQMIAFLKKKYPALNVALHAGELTPGLVPPRDLTSHITQAVTVAGARRIGHGVDLKYEKDRQSLLAFMAREKIGVVILLTSNAQILGVSGEDHPFRAYLDAGVPVMLATDDQGLSRGSHSGEFERAITTYRLHWQQVKQLIRNSMDQAFVQGKRLWKNPGDYDHMVDACEMDLPPKDAVSPDCDAYLQANEKAAEQWRLEKGLAIFEGRHWQ